MAAGSIIIDLLLKTGAFETDTGRAEKRLKAFQKQAENVGRAIGVSIAAGAAIAATAFQLLVDSASDFKDLEEQTGALAEDLASLAIPAAVAGKSVADLATDMNRLTKSLSGVDDDSKAAGAALSALGIPIDEFKKLDPVGQIDALSEAFNGFADGSQKTAVAMALFGKNGAAMLSVFKELEAEGGRQKILTQEQIELADEYADRQKRLTETIKLYAESAAVDVLPAVNDLTAAAKELATEFFGIDEAGKKLASESPVKEFARDAADVLAFLVDSGQGVVRIFQAIGTAIGATAAATVAYQKLEFSAAGRILAEARSDIEKTLSAELFSQRLSRLRAVAASDAANAGQFGFGNRPGKPQLSFDGAQKAAAKAGGDKQSEAQRYLETLEKQAEKTLELSTYEQALADIQAKRIKGLTPDLERQILAQAQFNDLNKQALDFRKSAVEVETAKAKADLKALESLEEGNKKLQEEVDLLGMTRDQLAEVELQKVRVAKAEKELTLAKQEAAGVDEKQLQVLQAEIDALEKREGLLNERSNKQVDVDASKNADKLGDSYRDSMSESIAEGILDGTRKGLDFTDIFVNELKAQFAKTILAPIIKPVVDAQNQGVASILQGLSGLFGSSSYSYQGSTLPNSLRGGAATGTNRLERDMITLVHEGEAIVPKQYNPAAGGMGGGSIQVVNNLGVQATAREERQQRPDGSTFRRLILDTVSGDFASGTGPASRAAQKRLGTGAGSLPRRG